MNKTKPQRTPAFYDLHDTLYPDTCEPLKAAAQRSEVTLAACSRGAYPGQRLPDKVVNEVRTVGYWDADRPQSWGLDWHCNEGIELTYLSRGQLYFGLDDGEYWMQSRQIGITRPWQRHRLGNPNITACRLHWLILDVGVRRPNQAWHWPRWLASSRSDLAELTEMLSYNEHPVWPGDEEIDYHFSRLAGVVDRLPSASAESRFRLHIGGLIVALTEVLRRHQPQLDVGLSTARRSVELFLNMLPEHLDQPWDLEGMATACGLGRSRFAHYCRQLTNMSPVEFLTVCRVQAASRLLETEPRWSITQVGLACGFGTSQYFATVFHRITGQTPSEFRAVMRHRAA